MKVSNIIDFNVIFRIPIKAKIFQVFKENFQCKCISWWSVGLDNADVRAFPRPRSEKGKKVSIGEEKKQAK